MIFEEQIKPINQNIKTEKTEPKLDLIGSFFNNNLTNSKFLRNSESFEALISDKESELQVKAEEPDAKQVYQITDSETQLIFKLVEQNGDNLPKHSFSVNDHQLLNFCLLIFTEKNQKASRKTTKAEISFTYKDYATVKGYDYNDANQRRVFKRAFVSSLNMLNRAKIERHFINKDGNKEHISISFFDKLHHIENDKVIIKLGESFIQELYRYRVKAPAIKQLFSRDLARDPTSYAIFLKLLVYTNNLNNITSGQNKTIKIDNLLKETPLPTKNELDETRQSWKLKIREPFFISIHKLITSDSFCYLRTFKLLKKNGSKREVIAEQGKEEPIEAYLNRVIQELDNRKLDYNDFLNLLFYFEPIIEVDHTKGLENKEQNKILRNKSKEKRKEEEQIKKIAQKVVRQEIKKAQQADTNEAKNN